MNRRILRVISLILLIVMSLLAQDKISVESTVDKQTITIGDRVTYTVKISADTSLVVDSLAVGMNLGMFEVKDYKPRDSRISNGFRVSTESFEITTFTTGDYQIPPITIRYRTKSGEVKSVSTDPLPIKVNSLLTGAEGEDLKPLRQPKEFKGEFPLWQVIVAAVVIAAIVIFIILYRRAKRPIDLSAKIIDTRPPWEIALAELAELRESDLVARGENKLFYLKLSEIFRHYLERRYGISALERTTYEIISEFRALALPKEEEGMIQDFLDATDVVKFAKYKPTAEDIERDFLAAKNFVIHTRSLPHATVRETA